MNEEHRGILVMDEDGHFEVPAEFTQDTTIRTPWQTVVRYTNSEREYDSENPGLHPARAVFLIAFEPHGSDDRYTYRLVPSAYAKVVKRQGIPENGSAP